MESEPAVARAAPVGARAGHHAVGAAGRLLCRTPTRAARRAAADRGRGQLAPVRRTKLPLYARAGVTEAWLVDLDAGRLEIHRGTGYRDVRIPSADEMFAPGAFADLALTLHDLLG